MSIRVGIYFARRHLEDIGRIIAGRCGGLPLAIAVMGGLFRNSHRTQDYWENMTKKRRRDSDELPFRSRFLKVWDGRDARSHFYCLHNLHCLHNSFFKKRPIRGDLLQNLTFPRSLQKLSLTNCVVKLESNSVVGTEWNPIKGEFLGVATYAALVSLMNTLDNIQNHPIHSFSLDKKQIQLLHKIIDFLLNFIESYNSHRGSKSKEVLESQIAAVHIAEDVIESHVVDQILAGETYLLDLERVIKDMKSFQKKAMQFKDRQTPSYSMTVASSKLLTTTKNAMVGFDDELLQLMDTLTGHQSNYIGQKCVEHFDIRVWITISQEYTVKNLFSELQTSHLSSSSFELNFQDEDKSWKLFCEKAFIEEGCPPELEESGTLIVRKCKGLPISIVVMGGLLRNSRRTIEYWESVTRDTNSILKSGNDEHCLKILSLSYNHLPAHLKPCFLYMGVFREDHHICVSEIIKLFVAKGFLKPNEAQSLEEVVEDYLKDLIDRNLVIVSSRKLSGRIKYSKMHDLVREVCSRIGEKEKFIYVIMELDAPPGIDRLEHCIVHYNRIPQNLPEVFSALPSASLVRTFKFEGGPLPFKFQLLRVLTCVDIFESPEDIFQHVNLCYLSHEPHWCLRIKPLISQLPYSLFQLWNVQTLSFNLENIWYMRQLRHLQFDLLILPPPSDKVEHLLPNLLTLSTVVNFNFTEEVCKRIPNIKKLGIMYNDVYEEWQKKCYYCFSHLHKLESLHYSFDQVPERGDLLQSLVFPSSLMKLSLKNYHLHWEDLNTFLLSLPPLEVLKLCEGAVVGSKWECVEEAFPRLKFLKICCEHLINWTTESFDLFPVLENLHLENMKKLEKIPSTAISSTEILEEQLSLGNEDLQVAVYFSKTEKDKSFGEKHVQLIQLKMLLSLMSSIKFIYEFCQENGFGEFRDLLQPSCLAPSTLSSAKNVMVGFDDELIQIMDRLTGQQPILQIIPIVGMGGIGKTTLANNVYDNLIIVEHFDHRAWATISQ
ncbi:hypothetical protein ACS0TY_007052 [Phlomoides rotata]